MLSEIPFFGTAKNSISLNRLKPIILKSWIPQTLGASSCLYTDQFRQNKNGEVLIVTLRRKPNRFEQKCLVRSALLFYAALLSFIHLNVLSNPPEDSLL